MTEHIFYHSDNFSGSAQGALLMRGVLLARKIVSVARFLAITGFAILFVSFIPSFWYLIRASDVASNTRAIGQVAEAQVNPKTSKERIYTPLFNSDLPKQNKLVISSIGLNANINEAKLENYESALKRGVWRVSDFGTPPVDVPMILAAHRFGYVDWSSFFRRTNSFYNLPETKIGDRVEVIWNQRKYVYEIYRASEGEEIKDYSADLILYTCRDLNSQIRVFRYARLLEI